jgi:predicted Zn-dependent protease
MSIHFQRAMVLMEQSRHDLAERELVAAVAESPNDAMVHGTLALCLAERDAFDRATEHADLAVHLAPELPYAHYARAVVLGRRNRPDEAEAAIAEALRLEPYDADYYAVLAQARLAQRRWADALSAAEEGLQATPSTCPATTCGQ